MPRLTISLNDEMHRALKEVAVSQGRSINTIIEESLQLRGIRPRSSARALVERARQSATMSEDEALRLAVEETRQQRSS